jgi:hypothetical protein
MTTSRAGSGSASSPLLQSSRRLLRRPPRSARGLLWQLPESPVPHLQRAPPTGYRFPRLQHLSTKKTSGSVLPGGYDYSSGLLPPEQVLTIYDAGLRQCSLRGRRLGFCLRGRSGLLSGRRCLFFRHLCSGFIPLPGQVRRFPAEYTN